MATSTSASRRTLLLSTLSGVIAGGAWGATIQALATPSTPTISIVGRSNSQIVLVDTTRIRVLLLLGTPSDDLKAQIPALLTMLHQRIDILVGTSSAINALEPNFRERWRVRHTFLFPEPDGVGINSSSQTWITQDVEADLGHGISLGFLLTTRNAWTSVGTTRYLWMVTIDTGATLVSLAPDHSSAQVHGENGATLIVVPEANVERLISTFAPASIAINSRDDLPELAEDTATMLVRIYKEDIARFEIRKDGIALPDWAEGTG